jgi:RNA polymerase sigma-70 factor (ECF subfamily)
MKHVKQAFMKDIQPYLDILFDVARRDLRFHEARGDIAKGELSPHEVVGETLLQAFAQQTKRPTNLSLKAWLLGIEDRVLKKLLKSDEFFRKLWAVSLEEPLPDLEPSYDENSFWEWYQPDAEGTWEDILVGSELIPEDLFEIEEKENYELEPTTRRAWLLYDHYGLSMHEVGSVLNMEIPNAAKLVRDMRKGYTKKKTSFKNK